MPSNEEYPEGKFSLWAKPICIVTEDPAGGLPYLEFYEMEGGTKIGKRFAQLRSAHPVATCKVDPCQECDRLYYEARMQEASRKAAEGIRDHIDREILDAAFKDPKGFFEAPGGSGGQS